MTTTGDTPHLQEAPEGPQGAENETVEQSARALGISRRSVERDSRLARLWLFKRMNPEREDGHG